MRNLPSCQWQIQRVLLPRFSCVRTKRGLPVPLGRGRVSEIEIFSWVRLPPPIILLSHFKKPFVFDFSIGLFRTDTQFARMCAPRKADCFTDGWIGQAGRLAKPRHNSKGYLAAENRLSPGLTLWAGEGIFLSCRIFLL